jgi:uncharacterized protein (TIGR00725 family)
MENIRLKYKVAVFGLGSSALSEQNKIDAYSLGCLIAERGHYLVTGMAKGVTQYTARGAKSKAGIVIGVNPYPTEDVGDDVAIANTDIIINTGLNDRARNVISVRSCDGMIVINGNFGVLNEITNGVGENKPIIVLKNSGGVSEIIEGIFKYLKPDYPLFKMAEHVTEALDLLEEMMKKNII